MTDDLHLLDDLVRELEGLSIKTTQGSFVKMEDIRRLTEKRQAAQAVDEKVLPAPKNVHEARAQAKEYLRGVGFGPKDPLEPGRAIPATESQSSSRT